MRTKAIFLCLFPVLVTSVALPAAAQDGSRLQKWREVREHRQDGKAQMDEATQNAVTDRFDGRDMLVYVAPNAPAKGNRAMVVVLHGGMGNANHIYSIIGKDMNGAADEGGFVVAYLNGSRASRLNEKFHAWNAGGGCCGQPFENGVDDIAYISRAVHYLTDKYGIDPQKIYGMGHSNGAMMTQRLMCLTDLYQAAIPVSGPLNITTAQCPAAKGKRILAIHGELDRNVPIGGGYGTKGVTDIEFKSEDYARNVFTKSGADYTIDEVKGADHSLKTIADTVAAREGRTFGQYAALFFGLAPKQ